MFETLIEFESNHGTWIVLRSGDHQALTSMIAAFSSEENPYPWAFFKEPGLNYAVTAVGIIVPERLYDEESTTAALADGPRGPYTTWEMMFLKYRVACNLAG